MNKRILYISSGAVVLIAIIFVLVKTKAWRNAKSIISTALSKLGEREIGTNEGFSNSNFESEMKSVGWFPGAQWCAFFAKYVWTNALSGTHAEKAKSLMNGSSQLTFDNFKNDTSGLFKVSSKPKPGAVVVWQSKAKPTTGHVGIVKSVSGTDFFTIEGNYSDKVSIVQRSTSEIPSNWNLRGFILPA